MRVSAGNVCGRMYVNVYEHVYCAMWGGPSYIVDRLVGYPHSSSRMRRWIESAKRVQRVGLYSQRL